MLNSIRLQPGVCRNVRLTDLLCRILEREPRNLGCGERPSSQCLEGSSLWPYPDFFSIGRAKKSLLTLFMKLSQRVKLPFKHS
jgi:hypothetical protein